MPLIVEYLLIVQKADTFCDSKEAFTALLSVDSSIQIEGGTALFKQDLRFGYAIASGDVKGKSQRYFHLRFTANDCDTPEKIDRFAAFLKVVRSVMNRMGSQPETLWDDISFHYSTNAYKLIHRVENLMRKLIANFMLITVGAEWMDESAPKEVKEAIGKSKRKEYLNVLHTVDFIHLADFLLRPYSEVTVDQMHERLQKANSLDDLNDLKMLTPRSNWSRYFSDLVDCDDKYLKKRWDSLYDLRCKVAHNAIVDKADYEQIATIAKELEHKIEDAIRKLPQVEVPHTEIDQIAESAASSVSEMMGDFVSAWRLLEGRAIKNAGHIGGRSTNFRQAIDTLRKSGDLDSHQFTIASELSQLKNHLIHPTGVSVSTEELRNAIRSILALIAALGGFEKTEREGGQEP
ncbi:MAG: hypothetical protein JNK90_07945 [Planctomycetaceae bacterium]|nr:hypothetical protein [Planctomycetaceae bacterium]